jgi:hypothetical protein
MEFSLQVGRRRPISSRCTTKTPTVSRFTRGLVVTRSGDKSKTLFSMVWEFCYSAGKARARSVLLETTPGVSTSPPGFGPNFTPMALVVSPRVERPCRCATTRLTTESSFILLRWLQRISLRKYGLEAHRKHVDRCNSRNDTSRRHLRVLGFRCRFWPVLWLGQTSLLHLRRNQFRPEYSVRGCCHR